MKKEMEKQVTQAYLNWLDRVLIVGDGINAVDLKNQIANDLAKRKLKQINK